MNNIGQTHIYNNPLGYGDLPRKRHKPTFWVNSGPNFRGKDGPFYTIEEARTETQRRPFWDYIHSKSGIIIERNQH